MDKSINEKIIIENPELFIDEFNQKEIDIHIAEYNALTTRSTYILNIQFVLLTALIAWIVVFGNIWNKDLENYLTWGLIFGAQLMGIVYANMFYENYCIICYIESNLKPKIRKLIKGKKIWEYEDFLITIRGTTPNKLSLVMMDYSWSAVSGIIIIGVVTYRLHYWNQWDWFGVSINILFFLFQITRTYQAVKLRLNSWKHSKYDD